MVQTFLQSLRNHEPNRLDNKLHQSCSGALHGHGIPKKSRPIVGTKDSSPTRHGFGQSEGADSPTTERHSVIQQRLYVLEPCFGLPPRPPMRSPSSRSLSSQSSHSSTSSDYSMLSSDESSNSLEGQCKVQSHSGTGQSYLLPTQSSRAKNPELLHIHNNFKPVTQLLVAKGVNAEHRKKETMSSHAHPILPVLELVKEEEEFMEGLEKSLEKSTKHRSGRTGHQSKGKKGGGESTRTPTPAHRTASISKSALKNPGTASNTSPAGRNTKPPTKSPGNAAKTKNDAKSSVTSPKPAPFRKSQSDGVQYVGRKLTPPAPLLRSASDSRVLALKRTPDSATIEKKMKELKAKPLKSDRMAALKRQSPPRAMTNASAAKTEEDLVRERAFLDSQRVWLPHTKGITAAQLLSAAGSESVIAGKIKLRLEPSGQVLDVDEDEVEKANPPQMDTIEDVSNLRYLNESSLLHTLRQRYGASLIHTNAGPSLIVINPMAPLAIYSERMIQLFKGCKTDDMPPHIYAAAQSAYKHMVSTRQDQALVFLGRSGSGKTYNFRHALHYLVVAAGCNTHHRVVTVEKLNAICLLLEAFGNCRTLLNTNATRFTEIFSLDFDQAGQIASASVQVLLAEKSRVTKRPEGEPNFHVFYELLAGAEGELRHYLQLDENLSESCAFMTPLQRQEDQHKARVSWSRLQAALDLLNITPQESKGVFALLAAIYHLGVAKATYAAQQHHKIIFQNPAAAQKAATLLGVSLETLSQYAFSSTPHGTPSGGTGTLTRNNYRSSPLIGGERTERGLEPTEMLEGLAQGLFMEAFNGLVALVNRSISSPAHTISSIVVVDTPGFQNPSSISSPGKERAGNFTDLCHNYQQERLQLLFHEQTMTLLQNRYAQEQLDVLIEGEEDEEAKQVVVNLLDRASQSNLLRSSVSNLHEADERGLLWLLDEEALMPVGKEEHVLEKLAEMYDNKDSEAVVSVDTEAKHLTIHHMQGTNSVVYDAHGWLKQARENVILRNASLLLAESSKDDILCIIQLTKSHMPTATLSGSVAGIEGSLTLRRASSMRRTFTSGTAGIKRKSLALQVKFQVDGLVETLRRCRTRFVHCFLPHHNAGLCDLHQIGSSSLGSADESLLNVPLLRSQLRGSEILAAIRAHRLGYPDHLPYAEFVRRFAILCPVDVRTFIQTEDAKTAAQTMLLHVDVETSSYRLGLSQIFFRPGILPQLEEHRDDQITGRLVQFQALCRGYLARRQVAKLRVQDVAIRCIQRNVRLWMSVRDWPWWRLLIKLSPVLNVHRTESELKEKSEELEALRLRVAALEKERADLKFACDKIGTRVSELTGDLAEEHATATLATERLEAESAERMKLEKEVQQLQGKLTTVLADHEKLEYELLVTRTATFNGDLEELADEDELSPDAAMYKSKYERACKELEFAKQRLQQQHEDDLEQLMALKKQLEKKLGDAYEEVEEQRQVVSQWKRKVQRLTAEQNDLRLLHEEQISRNSLLEKKQRKFDTEFGLLQDELRSEKAAKDRLLREKDVVLSDKYQLEQQVQDLQLDLDLKEEKVHSLLRELDELGGEGKSDTEMAMLRKQKLDLERKAKDQEEELDELAGQVQMLESAKLRVEMNLEHIKKEHKKELAMKDEEMEDVRNSAQKKVKALECQLESEHEERTLLVREKHELERRIAALNEHHQTYRVDEDTVQKLKKDLKRTKALLKDAQAALERARSETPSKVLLRQLRNQLEDAEFARTAAVKGRQHAEQELAEMQTQLDEALRVKGEAEDKYLNANRERASLQSQLDDAEAEMAEVMRKYKASVAQVSLNQITIQDQLGQLQTLEQERASLKEQLAELGAKLETLEGDALTAHAQKRLELKNKELESKVELEIATRLRVEGQVQRLKDALEKVSAEADASRSKEQVAQETIRRLQRQLREMREEVGAMNHKETEANQNVRELQQRLELLEAENATLVKDLSLAVRRIEDLQAALQGELEESDSENAQSDSDSDSDDFSDLASTLSPRAKTLDIRPSSSASSSVTRESFA